MGVCRARRGGRGGIRPPELGRCSGGRGILPFGITGYGVRARMASLLVQPCNVGLRIIPTNTHHRIAVGLREAGVFSRPRRILLPFEDSAAVAAAITGPVSRLSSKYRVLSTSNVILAQGECRR